MACFGFDYSMGLRICYTSLHSQPEHGMAEMIDNKRSECSVLSLQKATPGQRCVVSVY